MFSCTLMIMFYSNSNSSQKTLQVLILAPLFCKDLSPQQECFLGIFPLLIKIIPIGTCTTKLIPIMPTTVGLHIIVSALCYKQVTRTHHSVIPGVSARGSFPGYILVIHSTLLGTFETITCY